MNGKRASGSLFPSATYVPGVVSGTGAAWVRCGLCIAVGVSAFWGCAGMRTVGGNEQPAGEEYAQDLKDEGALSSDELLASARRGTEGLGAERFAPDAPTLMGFALEPTEDGRSMVVVDVTEPTPFDLRKTAPSEYTLTLNGVAIDPGATGTILSPDTSSLIRTVRPVPGGDSAILRIFASPNAELVAERRGGKIVVRSATLLDRAHEIRAQAKPGTIGGARLPEADPTSAPVIVSKPGDEAVAALPTSAPGTPEIRADGSTTNADLSALLDDRTRYVGRLISLDLQDTDIDNALRIIAEVSNLNIIASEDVKGKVTLRLIDVPWDQALDVILKTNGLDKVQDGNVIRIAPVEKLRLERENLKQARQAEEDLEPLQVRYIRISYARASELKPLVDTVLTERGSSNFDERTNQLIIKDITKGLDNVEQLISKIDLRTPQVLLETQIVEASRSLLRDLGTELGFQYIQSAATGNSTGYNFPSSVVVGGSAGGTFPSGAVRFPAAITDSGSALSFLFGSADGTKSLGARISALENEGRVRVISRPSIATTNNKEALIKSTETVRVRTPQGGLSVATGQGASAGQTNAATEEIEIGIELTVTPQASPDYYVLLDIQAKSSTFGGRVVDGIPSELKREAKSAVLVSSGQTFAMGGIYKLTDRDTVSGVPWLKDVPVFGTLFRRTLFDGADEELLFFITPRIVEGSFDDATMRSANS